MRLKFAELDSETIARIQSADADQLVGNKNLDALRKAYYC